MPACSELVKHMCMRKGHGTVARHAGAVNNRLIWAHDLSPESPQKLKHRLRHRKSGRSARQEARRASVTSTCSRQRRPTFLSTECDNQHLRDVASQLARPSIDLRCLRKAAFSRNRMATRQVLDEPLSGRWQRDCVLAVSLMSGCARRRT